MTEAELEAAAKAIWIVCKAHDQFGGSWDSATHADKVFAYSYAKMALEAAEKVRNGQ